MWCPNRLNKIQSSKQNGGISFKNDSAQCILPGQFWLKSQIFLLILYYVMSPICYVSYQGLYSHFWLKITCKFCFKWVFQRNPIRQSRKTSQMGGFLKKIKMSKNLIKSTPNYTWILALSNWKLLLLMSKNKYLKTASI